MPPSNTSKRLPAGKSGGGRSGAARRAQEEARRLVRQLEEAGSPILQRALDLAASSAPESRRVACELLPTTFDEDPPSALAALAELAADPESPVRAAAAAACARLAGDHFERVLAEILAWRDHASPHVRRAAALACGRAAEPHRLERAPHLLRFIAPLLGDSDPVVRRAVGSSLGTLLGAYPEPAFEALIGWSTSSDPNVLRNVAAAFAAEPAAGLAKRALIVLRKLALDERHAVWRATATATWQLGRRRPDVVRPEVERWLEDEARAKVAREALRYL